MPHRRFAFASLILAALLAVPGCSSDGGGPADPPPPDPDPEAPVLKGLGLSPLGFPVSFDRLLDFFAEVDGIPDAGVLWNGSWRDDVEGGTDAGQIPEAAQVVALQGSRDDIFVFGWRTEEGPRIRVPDDARNDWTNETAIARFQSMIESFASTYRPRYLFLGNESDFYFEEDPVDYARWIAVYDDTYDLVKSVSPDTHVGPVFNFEHMAGSGGLNGWTDTHWGALDAHSLAKVDIVGLTVYPWFEHATAAAVPATYLAPLFQRIGDTPIAITETGWPAENIDGLNPLWETSEQAQVTFMGRLDAMISDREVEVLNWLFLNGMVDPGGSPIAYRLFGSVSLRNANGQKRAIYDPWVAFRP